VRDPHRLVFVHTAGASGRDGPPYPFVTLVRDRANSFEAVSAFSPSPMELTLDRGPEMARGVWVSGNFYEMLGVRPLIGRSLTAGDDRIAGQGGPDGAVAVISRTYWQQRFAGDPTVIGRSIYLDRRSVTIVGVMPTEIMSLEPGNPIDIAVPIVLSDPARLHNRTALWLFMVARLAPATAAEQARAEVETLFKAYMADVQTAPGIRTRLFQRSEISPAAKGLNGLRSRFVKPLTALLILAGLVLLAACVNVTNLILARATARRRDFAVRLAIGAGRGRLVRQQLTESLVLVLAGAALGIVLAHIGATALAAYFADAANRIVLDLSLNLRMLLFTLGVAALSGLALGIVPALRATRLDPAAGLQGGSRGVAGNRVSLRLGRTLVVVQVALSMVLVAGAGLFIRTLHELESVDLGFAREGILSVEVIPERQLSGTPEWLALQTEILDRVRQIPGLQSASWATANPMSGRGRGAIVEVPGFVPSSDKDNEVHMAAISPDHFDTLGVPLLLGRRFTASDHPSAPKVAILNQTAARFYFGNANPIGRKVRFTNYPARDLIYEVVGVVRDAKHYSLRESASRFIYLPIPQHVERIHRLALAARCSGDALAFAAPVRRHVQNVRATLFIQSVSTMEQQIGQAVFQERLLATLSTTFGTVALVLACIGLYGILAYAVTRRTNEIGIRMALGATQTQVVWLVLREAFALTAGGIAIGLPVVLALGQLTKATLYGVEPFDPVTFGAAAMLLLVFAALAATLPGRRASMLDPTAALRRE
ncbi:MAG: hypothetical protein K0S78_2366, partial [Thermomicrobiales bacterium]|nr:hypothetical protein [Thermomicrobiales bacterium]